MHAKNIGLRTVVIPQYKEKQYLKRQIKIKKHEKQERNQIDKLNIREKIFASKMFKLLYMIPIRRGCDWLRSTPTFYRPSTVDFTIKHHIGRRLSQEMVQVFSKDTQSDSNEFKPPTTSNDLSITNTILDEDQIEWDNLKMRELKIKNKFKMHTKTDFQTIRNDNILFVDRSNLIYELFDSFDKSDSILITHPRRTGKTVNLEMIRDFCELQVKSTGELDLDKQEEKRQLFLGNRQKLSPLKIAQYCSDKSELLSKHLGKHPVIYLSLRSLEGKNLEDFQTSLKQLLGLQFENKRYLFEKLNSDQQKRFQNYIDNNTNSHQITLGLQQLCQFLYDYHHEQVVVLVDEYDKYINDLVSSKIVDYGLVFDIAKQISSMLNEVGKDQKTVNKLIITGILDYLVKEVNSGFNNLKKLGISDQPCDGFYGLTEEEVKEKVTLIVDPDQDKYDEKMNLLMKLIKKKYNGYQGYNSTYYNIWSVYSYLDQISYQYYKQQEIPKPSSFWAKSGFCTTLSSFMEKSLNSSLRDTLVKIALGQPQTLEYEENDVNILKALPTDQYEQEILYSYLLLNQGYITRSKPNRNCLNNNQFKVPNEELREEFDEVLKTYLNNSLGIIKDLELEKAFISRNESQIQAKFEEYLQVAVSFRDNAKKSTEDLQTTPDEQKIDNPKLLTKKKEQNRSKLESEQYYHSITFGFLFQMNKYYGINSELETGLGYSDIILLPKQSQDKHALLLELKLGPKITKSYESNASKKLTPAAEIAIRQIKQKGYENFLLKNGFKNYSYVGIAFSGKYVKVIVEDHITNQ